MTRPLSPRALREAAEVASETGCGVVIERGPDGVIVYKVTPPGKDGEPVNPADLVDWSK